jgi:hypothetical protein
MGNQMYFTLNIGRKPYNLKARHRLNVFASIRIPQNAEICYGNCGHERFCAGFDRLSVQKGEGELSLLDLPGIVILLQSRQETVRAGTKR